MFHGKKIVVVMPAYHAASSIERTCREIPLDLVDEVIVNDDASHDESAEISRRLGAFFRFLSDHGRRLVVEAPPADPSGPS